MKYFSLTLIFAFIAASVTYAQNDYFPLSTNSTQTYKIGKKFQDPISKKHFTQTKITDETKEINGKIYQIIQTFLGDGETFEPFMNLYFRTTNDGAVYSLMDEKSEEQLALPANNEIKVGKTWTTSISGYSFTYKISSLTGSITTPEGTFTDCLVFEQSSDGVMMRSYNQKGVGMVASTMEMEGEEIIQQYLVK